MSTTTIPASAPLPARKSDAVQVLPVVIDLGFVVAASILFNFFPERVGYWTSAARPESFVPVLAPGFGGTALILLNLWWGLAFSLGVIKLVRRRWTPALRRADLGVTALGALALAALAAGGSIGDAAGTGLEVRGLFGLASFGLVVAALKKYSRLAGN